ncbi:hypothetical protein [Altericroceibacterium endophyticum]|uniref:Uncharacterized protein n=1 Tax=Altericroceibacterium endophyticum TaxID=1808508 RepID=A0A6I4T708_9SPHN|nr:hypothetical protein [Altericroceibacterium endophyticum]MXO65793.1 hypothetical protein [Altericroceibacterium endophyticum]
MTCHPRSTPAFRRYMRRFLIATGLYIGTFMIGVRLVPDDAPPSPLYIGLALLPGLAILGWIWAMGRLLIEMEDEYLRMLEVRKFMIATAFALTISGVWGLLELYVTVPRLPVFMIFPLWCVGLAVGQIWNRVSGA